MRLVTLRGTWAAVAGLAEIGLGLHRALRGLAARRIAHADRQRHHVRRNVEHDPMPPAAPGRRIGVVHRYREALGTCRRVLPGERRRHVAAVTPEALVYLHRGDCRAGLDFGAFETKRTCRERGQRERDESEHNKASHYILLDEAARPAPTAVRSGHTHPGPLLLSYGPKQSILAPGRQSQNAKIPSCPTHPKSPTWRCSATSRTSRSAYRTPSTTGST